MNPIDRWRRRARAAVRPAQQETSLDYTALALAIWLACLVVVQLVMRAPELPSGDAATIGWPTMTAATTPQ